MGHKLRILGQFELRQTWDEKMILFYTLICPAIYYVIADISTGGRPFGLKNVAYQLLGYWVYIILVGVLNGFQFGLIGMRESNFLKMFTLISGDKRLIFYSNLLVQTLFIQVEIVCFDLFVLILDPAARRLLPVMMGGLLVNFILIPIVVGFTNFILVLPIRVNLASLLAMGYILLAMLLVNITVANEWLTQLLIALNPGSYMVAVYSMVLLRVPGQVGSNGLLLVVIAGVYLVTGYYWVQHMSLQSNTSRY